jgi:glutamate synthase (NADPH) small chain
VGKPTGFMEYGRALPRRRPIPVRLRDWREVYESFPQEAVKEQGARCMDCGIPFCHEGCPLGNLIPEWNDLVYRDDWPDAMERLHSTNNFPEFTGRLCPAPCEASCVLGINEDPVTIERIEYEIVERAWSEGWVTPQVPTVRTGKSVAVVGSGPAGLAVAQQLARAGHAVTVFERAERPGGLLRYGIPEFKMEKAVLDRRLAQLEAEGVSFVCSTSVGGSAQGAAGARAGAGAGALSPRAIEARRSSRGRSGALAPPAVPTCRYGRRRRYAPSSTRWSWPAAPPCPASCRCRAGSSTASISRWST